MTPAATLDQRLAHSVSEILAPAVVVLVLPLAVAWSATGFDPWWTLVWGLEVALFSSVIPMAFIIRGARQGRWDTHHVRDREHRFLPLMVGLASTLVGLLVLVVGRAPRDVLAFSLSMLATLVVCIVITRRWKVSLHAAVAGGAVAMITLLYGWWSLLLLVPLVAVCWARVVLREHTVAQVVVGALLGPVFGGAVFLLVR